MSFVKRLSPLITVKRKTNTDKVPTGLLGNKSVTADMLQELSVTPSKLAFSIPSRLFGVATSGVTALQAVTWNGSAYVPAQANNYVNSRFAGFIVNNYQTLPVDLICAGVVSGFSGLVQGSIYYLDQATPGAVTATRPATGIIVPLGVAINSTQLRIIFPVTPDNLGFYLPSIVNNAPMTVSVNAAGQVLYWNGTAFDLAVANTVASSKVAGIAIADETGVVQDVVTSGIVQGVFSGLTPNATYYLSQSSAGAITATIPTSGLAIKVGRAIKSDQLLLELDNGGVYAAGSGPTTINFANGQVQSLTMSAAITAFSNAVPGKIYTLIVTTDGNTYSWPASITWASNSVPSLGTNGSVTIINFTCLNSTTFYGAAQQAVIQAPLNLVSANIYDAIVGSSAQVTAGKATYSSINAAISAVTAGSKIYVLKGTYSENVSVDREIVLEGMGHSTVINGTLTFTGTSDYSSVRSLKVTGNITLNSGADGIFIKETWMGTSAILTDSGSGNSITIIQE